MTFPYQRYLGNAFPDLENFYFKFHDFPDFSRICMNPDHGHSDIGKAVSWLLNDDTKAADDIWQRVPLTAVHIKHATAPMNIEICRKTT